MIAMYFSLLLSAPSLLDASTAAISMPTIHNTKLSAEHAIAIHDQGVQLYGAGQWVEALEQFDRAIELAPKFSEAYNSRGLTYHMLEMRHQAIADFDQAVQVNPRYAEAFFNRALAKFELGAMREAIADMDKAIELDPLPVYIQHRDIISQSLRES